MVWVDVFPRGHIASAFFIFAGSDSFVLREGALYWYELYAVSFFAGTGCLLSDKTAA